MLRTSPVPCHFPAMSLFYPEFIPSECSSHVTKGYQELTAAFRVGLAGFAFAGVPVDVGMCCGSGMSQPGAASAEWARGTRSWWYLCLLRGAWSACYLPDLQSNTGWSTGRAPAPAIGMHHTPAAFEVLSVRRGCRCRKQPPAGKYCQVGGRLKYWHWQWQLEVWLLRGLLL